jgi:cation diffusion facilitator CzcD-associated flavoprotein CzcO
MAATELDVAIIGAGISGIGMAVHLQKNCPDRSFALIEARSQLGGTWDLFRYPGIRSDSDMHTLGFIFEPWRERKAIADGPSILAYLNRIADERGIRQHIRFGQKLVAANWSSQDARWTLDIAHGDGSTSQVTARYVYLGSGYYDYDEGHDPEFPGRETFQGRIVHPQFWPADLDYAGKRVVVIGSGATAVTLVPNMAKQAAHVTMLQRTPTWYFIRPAQDRIANALRAVLPDSWAYALVRFKNVRMQKFFFNRARSQPDKVGAFLKDKVRDALGGQMNEADFTPPYNPWDQRLCLVPDADMFTAMREGKAEIVTDRIERFDETGILLASGRHIEADVIVTATGLKLAVAGKAAFAVDGERVDWHRHFYYKGSMFSNVPNLSVVFGYLNASWTLKADIIAEYSCRVLNHMRATGSDIAVPLLSDTQAKAAETVFDFSSGYVQRALSYLPQNGTAEPWRLNQDYLHDRELLRSAPIEDGVLRFARAGEISIRQNGTAAADPVAEAIAAE